MKTLLALLLTCSSVNAFAAIPNVAAALDAFKAAESAPCRDVTAAMAKANMVAGVQLRLLLEVAEKSEGDTKAAAQKNMEQIVEASEHFSADFNRQCVAESAVFTDSN